MCRSVGVEQGLFAWRRLGVLLLVVAGCPQLAKDDFGVGVGGAMAGSPDAAGTAGTAGSGGLEQGGAGADGVAGAGGHLERADAGLGGDAPSNGGDAAPTPVQALRSALVHRYDLSGLGFNPADSMGGDVAYIYNTVLNDAGYLSLNGVNQYMSLPNGLLSASNDCTIELWLLWRGGGAWQRIFDFGTSDAGELSQGTGTTYLFLTPMSDDGVMFVAYSQDGISNEVRLPSTAALPTDGVQHVAVVVDSTRNTLALYLNGLLDGQTALTQRLASITDNNMWIGHSQYLGDPDLDADVMEVRIYDRALDADELALSHQLGPDGLL